MAPLPQNLENLRWIALLASTITWGLVGTTGANLVAGQKRSHNRVKLINECLARHQLSYTTFYFSLVIAIKELPEPVGLVISTLAGIAILFFLGGLALTKDPVAKLGKLGHDCANDGCAADLGGSAIWRLLRGNILLTAVSFLVAVAVVALAPLAISTQKPNSNLPSGAASFQRPQSSAHIKM